MFLFWMFFLVFGASWVLTSLLYRYAVTKSLMDVPNARSSHSLPTPRGGGLAIVITFSVGLVILWSQSLLSLWPFLGMLGAGLLVALIGFIDDHGHIAARWRLLIHFIAAGWLLFCLDGLPALLLFGDVYDLGWFGNFLAVIALVWLLNLYNFMDGTDGLASIEALSAVVITGLISTQVIYHQEYSILQILLAASVSGFLIWNYPPAKIFMGDAGSGFIGIMLGAFAMYGVHLAQQMLWVWIILLGVFVVDATFTLIHRMLRGDKIYDAHRSHAYQFAFRKFDSHKYVMLAVLLVNLCWLTPWAFAVAYGAIDGVSAVFLSYIPLIWLAWFFNAGALEEEH